MTAPRTIPDQPDDAWIATNLAPLGDRREGMVGPNSLLVTGPGGAVS